jgi:hypothetical protein
VPQRLVEGALILLGGYLACGAVFAVAFHALGLARVDPAARGAGPGFRLLVTPGIVALWPLLLLRWRAASSGRSFLGSVERPVTPRGLRRLHAYLAAALAVLLPLVLAAALAWRAPEIPPTAWPAGLATGAGR